MVVNIRVTIESDFEGIASLLKSTNLADNYFTKEKFNMMIERNKGFCFVAEEDKKIVGSVFGNHDGAFRGYIQKIAVSEKYKRQGIASRLIITVLRRLDEIKIPLVFAHAEKNNTASIDLLKSLGFEIRDSHYLIDRGFQLR